MPRFGSLLILLLLAACFAAYGWQAKPAEAIGFHWPEGKRGAVSLSFDDGRPSQLDNGIPVLDRLGVKATFYLNPRPVAERTADWKQVRAGGHEIGNHTMTHPCSGNFSWSRTKALENFTLEGIARDIDEGHAALQEMLGSAPTSFAYPCGQKFVGRGAGVQSYVPLVSDRYVAGRGWLDESANDPGFCDLAQLFGMELDGLSPEAATRLMNEAMEQNRWLVFAGHDIGASGRQTVLTPTLEAICRHANDPSQGIWIAPVDEIARYIRQQRRQ